MARFDVVMCPELLAEIRDALTTRPRLRRWVELDVAVTFIEAEIRDPDDDYLVALARENDVELIVSGDKDLSGWAAQRPPVVTPADFEGRLSAME